LQSFLFFETMITRRDFIKITAAGSALVSVGKVAEAQARVQSVLPDDRFVAESARKLPLIAEVDLVVVGGSSRAVAAAAAAAKAGCKVFLVAGLPYLGDDICGSMLYDLAKEDKLQTPLARKIFNGSNCPAPLHVKTTLEDALIENGVDFLYSSYVTEALTNAAGKVAGVAIVNRSGRQAVSCKAVIDATHTASVAAMFGASLTPFRPGRRQFRFTVVGNSPKQADEIVEVKPFTRAVYSKGKKYPATQYIFSIDIKDSSYASLAAAEQLARDRTWDADQVDSSDLLWYIPEETILSRGGYHDSMKSVRRLPESAFRPKDIDNLWVISPAADLSRTIAERVFEPANSLFLGEILGDIIGRKVKDIAASAIASVRRNQASEGLVGTDGLGEIGEVLKPLRESKGFVDLPAGALPVLGSYDVVVLGGGTAGATAGISAAQHGASTVVLEYLHGLGGLSSLGLIGRYWDGFREGYTALLDKGIREIAPEDHPRQLKDWKEASLSDWKMEWLRRELLKAKGQLWFGVMGCGALIDKNVVKGIVVATPFGRGVILSKTLIDATGAADIAIAAGAAFESTGKRSLAVQGAGLGRYELGDYYNNNDWLFVDDTDVLDISRAFVQAKVKNKGAYDIVKIPQTRERRRVVGEHTISVYDVLNHRRYNDTISFHQSSFDTHGYIYDPYFILSPPMQRHKIYDADVPLRSLLPKGLDGILTTGLGVSAHRDAMPVIRMQPCLQNQGYAVGYLSAVACKEGKPVRKVDIRKVQKYLVGMGNLPERVLTDRDFKGFSRKETEQAAIAVADDYTGLEMLLTDKPLAMDLLGKRLAADGLNDVQKLNYASILCMLGDDKYMSVLIDYIKSQTAWDKGWHYTGMGQFGMCLSRMDTIITALGNTKNAAALPVILDKARLLEPENEFSHYRAIAMATEAIGSRESLAVLEELLTAPGVRGHDLDSYITARRETVPDENDVTTRNMALKELHLARALYLCGDSDQLGASILRRYASGLQGHYARYAEEIINSD
jgi:flavin-dependent dehydrogenase